MRYSFHGKVRATGQQVDGFVEAANATQAIDRLADQGIIGVYSVRPEAKTPKNSIVLSGEAELQDAAEAAAAAARPRLDKSSSRSRPISAAAVSRSHSSSSRPVQAEPVPAPVAAEPMVSAGTENVMTQLVDKLATLLVQVEKLLSRPQQVIYQSGPVRGGGGGTKRSGRAPSEAQNNTLRDIFQTNLDLRQSLERLANSVNPAPAPAMRTNGAVHGEKATALDDSSIGHDALNGAHESPGQTAESDTGLELGDTPGSSIEMSEKGQHENGQELVADAQPVH